MKSFMFSMALSGLSLMVGTAAVMLLDAASISRATAETTGVWANCVAFNNGINYAILGVFSPAACGAVARDCTGNPNVTANWYNAAVIVSAPLSVCRRR